MMADGHFPYYMLTRHFAAVVEATRFAPERTPLPAVAKLQIGSSYPVVGVDALREDAELFERRCV